MILIILEMVMVYDYDRNTEDIGVMMIVMIGAGVILFMLSSLGGFCCVDRLEYCL